MEQKQQTINDNESGGRATHVNKVETKQSLWERVINWIKNLFN